VSATGSKVNLPTHVVICTYLLSPGRYLSVNIFGSVQTIEKFTGVTFLVPKLTISLLFFVVVIN